MASQGRRRRLSIGAACTMGALVGALPVSAAVLPVTAGSASGYQSVQNLFDAQPSADPIAGPTADNFGSGGGFYTADGRAVYFDFGANWNHTVISGVWMGLKNYGTDPSDANGTLVSFWSADINKNFEPANGDTNAPNFNIFTWTGATTAQSWQEIWSGSQAPGAQYLILAFDGTQVASNRPIEMVFTGSAAVPEPASLGLLAVGGLMAIRRRR